MTILIETQGSYLTHQDYNSFHLRPHWDDSKKKGRGSGGLFFVSKSKFDIIYAKRKTQILIIDCRGIRFFITYLSPSRAVSLEEQEYIKEAYLRYCANNKKYLL